MNRHKISLIAVIAVASVVMWSLLSCSGKSNPTSSRGENNLPPANRVEISGSAFNPASITIKVGEKVTWTNKDNISHTVTSDNGAFTSSGNLSSDATYEFTFLAEGTYPYHCAIHPTMKGNVTVTQ